MVAPVGQKRFTLVLGGAASGKSLWAEQLVRGTGLNKLYIATTEPFDDEMQDKVAKHRDQRGPDWDTREVPVAVADALENVTGDDIVLLDCATIWLSNLMMAEADVASETETLCAALRDCAGSVVVVSNELGMGLVPETSLGRKFRNLHGAMNQKLAAAADTVVFVAAGLPMYLKGAPE